MKVPLLDLSAQYADIMPDIKAELEKVFANHMYILGPAVKEFEEIAAQHLQVKHAIGCASGTDALILALLALGIGPGDEVITTPFTFFASVSSIHRVGAKPVFVDIDPKTYNIDPAKIEAAITPATKAILPVHLFGQPADMQAIRQIAHKHNLKVVEDNAQGIGATFNGKTAGSFGDIGTLSFFPSKNLGAMGDAGMCLTNDDDLANKLRQLRVHGESPKYYHHWVGLNSRIDSLQAAVLKVKIHHLDAWSEGRRHNAQVYQELLADVPQITLPYIDNRAVTIYNQYTIRATNRADLMAHLQAAGVGCAVYYPLSLHLQECFAYLGHKKGDFPVSEQAQEEVLSLPVFGELSHGQLEYVAETIKEFYL